MRCSRKRSKSSGSDISELTVRDLAGRLESFFTGKAYQVDV